MKTAQADALLTPPEVPPVTCPDSACVIPLPTTDAPSLSFSAVTYLETGEEIEVTLTGSDGLRQLTIDVDNDNIFSSIFDESFVAIEETLNLAFQTPTFLAEVLSTYYPDTYRELVKSFSHK